jgi:hypothetical protein
MRRDAFTPGLLVPVLAGLLVLLSPGAAAFAASNDWSRVVNLKKNTDVWVQLRNGDVRSGRIIAADSNSVTVRSMGEDEQIPRGAVQQVTRIYTRASVPVVAAAVAAGLAGSAALLYGCGGGRGSCDGGEFVAVVGIPVTLYQIAHWRTSTERIQIVYEATPVKTSTDMPTDWETVRRALPPSLQGVR